MSANARKLTAILGLIVLLPLIFLIGRWTGGGPAHEEHGEVATAAPEGETLWTCSMHPQVQQPEPGQCPICGMDLIPMAAEDGGDEESDLPRLRVSERSAALMNIQTWPVERREVEREVRLLGRVDFDETRRRTVTAWVPGRLDRIFVNVEGARIQRGDPVAEIYSPALISAQEELLQAIRTSRSLGGEESAMVEAARQRLGLLGLGEDQVEEIEERGTVEDHIVIHSPIDGVITDRIAVEGAYVQAGDPIAALVALDRVFVDLEAYERDLPWLLEGQNVRFSVEGLAGESFEGRIDQINPYVDERRRTAQVRVVVENSDKILKPGMYAQGVVESRLGDPDGVEPWRGEPPLIIPATAALITGRRAVVYVKISDTDRPVFELREVSLGPRAGDRFIVRDGVSEGEIVVTHGNFKIDAELQLRGQPSMMAPPDAVEGGSPDSAEEGEDADPEALREEPQPVASPEDVPEEFAKQVARLAESYLELSEHLAEEEYSQAQAAAAEMEGDLEEIDEGLLDEEDRESWQRLREDMAEALEQIGRAEDIERVRQMLQPLTDALEIVLISYQNDQVEPLYRAYCPMAFGDLGGTWLQRGREINNPYLGESMLRCGEILGQPGDDE